MAKKAEYQRHFKAKFQKGQKVMTPDGLGVIEDTMWLEGQLWYGIGGKYYSESELRAD